MERINWHAVVQSITDTWLPLLGWVAAFAVAWLIWGMFRRDGKR